MPSPAARTGRRRRAPHGGLDQLVLPQTVKSADFAGQRAQRRRLNILLVGDLLHLQVVVPYRLALRPNLVEARRLQQHAAVGAGHPSDGKEADNRSCDKDIGVVERDWDLAQITIFLAGYKNDVVAFAQRTHSKRGYGLARTTPTACSGVLVAFSYMCRILTLTE